MENKYEYMAEVDKMYNVLGIMKNVPPVIETDDWQVRRDSDGVLGVYANRSKRDQTGGGHVNACITCARQAFAGDVDAMAAVLMCHDDEVLQDAFERVKKQAEEAKAPS